MIYELILANVAGEELGNYEDDFKNGTFDFTKYPEATARLQEIAPYFLEGTASALEEDAATYMSDGLAAMCLAGNWNGGMILGSLENGAASLPRSAPPASSRTSPPLPRTHSASPRTRTARLLSRKLWRSSSTGCLKARTSS